MRINCLKCGEGLETILEPISNFDVMITSALCMNGLRGFKCVDSKHLTLTYWNLHESSSHALFWSSALRNVSQTNQQNLLLQTKTRNGMVNRYLLDLGFGVRFLIRDWPETDLRNGHCAVT